MKNSGFEFPETTSSEWNSILQNFRKNDNLSKYTQIFLEILTENFFSIWYPTRIFFIPQFSVWWFVLSEIQQFPDFM